MLSHRRRCQLDSEAKDCKWAACHLNSPRPWTRPASSFGATVRADSFHGRAWWKHSIKDAKSSGTNDGFSGAQFRIGMPAPLSLSDAAREEFVGTTESDDIPACSGAANSGFFDSFHKRRSSEQPRELANSICDAFVRPLDRSVFLGGRNVCAMCAGARTRRLTIWPATQLREQVQLFPDGVTGGAQSGDSVPREGLKWKYNVSVRVVIQMAAARPNGHLSNCPQEDLKRGTFTINGLSAA